MPELFTLKINHGVKWSENAYTGGFEAWFDYVDKDFMSFFEIDEMFKKLGYDRFILYHYRIPGMSYREGLRLIEWDQDVGKMCKYVPRTREIEMYLEHLSPKRAAMKHKLLMNLDESGILKKGVTIEDIEESRVAISITKGSGSKLKKGRAKGGANHLEKGLCLFKDIPYNGDDEHEAKATEGEQGSGDEVEDGMWIKFKLNPSMPITTFMEIVKEERMVEIHLKIAYRASTSKAPQPSQSSQPCTQEAPQPSPQPTQASQTTSKSTARGHKRRMNVP
ncbi:hypothetical protein D8674_017921 [Pyrus ussuriensis x Pyrus communis]|uniref:PB1-like domain-containing protein n=1 Tax=Pyrus ussuriensis x Pyrus communis TaxID=2448454 RepID=A0A5N5HJ92_9ROSA|nr:hypothetical protein D8674_017921 [Pyrus ussuriensis x Pyrus communis]